MCHISRGCGGFVLWRVPRVQAGPLSDPDPLPRTIPTVSTGAFQGNPPLKQGDRRLCFTLPCWKVAISVPLDLPNRYERTKPPIPDATGLPLVVFTDNIMTASNDKSSTSVFDQMFMSIVQRYYSNIKV